MKFPNIALPDLLVHQTWAPMYDECYSCRGAQYDYAYSSSWLGGQFDDGSSGNHSSQAGGNLSSQAGSQDLATTNSPYMDAGESNKMVSSNATVDISTASTKKESFSESFKDDEWLLASKKRKTTVNIKKSLDTDTCNLLTTGPASNLKPAFACDPATDLHTFTHLAILLSKQESLTSATKAKFVAPFRLFGANYTVKKYAKYVQKHRLHVAYLDRSGRHCVSSSIAGGDSRRSNGVSEMSLSKPVSQSTSSTAFAESFSLLEPSLAFFGSGLTPGSSLPEFTSSSPTPTTLSSASLSSSPLPALFKTNPLFPAGHPFERRLMAAAARHKHRKAIPHAVALRVQADRVKFDMYRSGEMHNFGRPVGAGRGNGAAAKKAARKKEWLSLQDIENKGDEEEEEEEDPFYKKLKTLASLNALTIHINSLKKLCKFSKCKSLHKLVLHRNVLRMCEKELLSLKKVQELEDL